MWEWPNAIWYQICWRIEAKYSIQVLIKLFLYIIITRNISAISWSTVSVKSIPSSFTRGWTAEKCEARNMRTLVVIGNLYQQASGYDYFPNMVIAGRHRNIQLIALKYNLFQLSKHSKTIELNVTRMILFMNPRDLEQIGALGRQTRDRQLLIDAYNKSKQGSFGYLMIDFASRTDAQLNFCNNCSVAGPSVFFVSSINTRENLTNESTRALYVWIFCKRETNR